MNKKDSLYFDSELTLIQDTWAKITEVGLSISWTEVANFLVALKSKPLIILIGPPDSAKETFINYFVNNLIGSDSYRYQTMLGHPWWATQSINVALNTRMQSQFNSLKLEIMLEEAGLPKNRKSYFFAEMIKISPSELLEYFTDMAFQIKNRYLMRLPASHFSEPVLFPSNFCIIGTMDVSRFIWLDHDLLSQTTVIDCVSVNSPSTKPIVRINSDPEREKFLIKSSIRDSQGAFGKLFKIMRNFPGMMSPFFKVNQILHGTRFYYPKGSLTDVMIYLANSWSYTGQGLFDDDSKKNLQIAMDLAMIQSFLLPFSEKISQSKTQQNKLHKVLATQFPQASAYINRLNP